MNDEAAKQATKAAIRVAGTAMWAWLADQLPGGEPSSEEAFRAASLAAPDLRIWDQDLSISADELERLLVPRYLEALPRQDGWGHELEFCLHFDPEDPSRYLAVIRSAGSEGKFESDPYDWGPFSVSELHKNMIWLQGIFVRWPGRE